MGRRTGEGGWGGGLVRGDEEDWGGGMGRTGEINGEGNGEED